MHDILVRYSFFIKSGQAFNLDLRRTSWGFVGVSNSSKASLPASTLLFRSFFFQNLGLSDSKAAERVFTRTDLKGI